MAFWWASQGKNHPIAIEQGSLWTCRWANGSLPTDRALIKEVQVGDVVFHYQGPAMRAISVVTSPWRPYPRPDGYPKKAAADPDDGWLVEVSPVIKSLTIHRDRIAMLLPHGAPGPLDQNGTPQQKYLSRLAPEDGDRLLMEVDVADSSLTAELPAIVESNSEVAGTDSAARVWLRIEQRGLRKYLLGDQLEAACGLCGQVVPVSLLVAGHIKPRAACTDQERWDYPAVAMLTCLFGCDALFEHGYITVDDDGLIVEGRTTENRSLSVAIARLLGSSCPAFNRVRAHAFRAHREISRSR